MLLLLLEIKYKYGRSFGDALKLHVSYMIWTRKTRTPPRTVCCPHARYYVDALFTIECSTLSILTETKSLLFKFKISKHVPIK